MSSQDSFREIQDIKNEIGKLHLYISGEAACYAMKNIMPAIEQLTRNVSALVNTVQSLGEAVAEDKDQLKTLEKIVYGNGELGLVGLLEEVRKELRFVKWVGAITAAALITSAIGLVLNFVFSH
jgi:hypothetical protein